MAYFIIFIHSWFLHNLKHFNSECFLSSSTFSRLDKNNLGRQFKFFEKIHFIPSGNGFAESKKLHFKGKVIFLSPK